MSAESQNANSIDHAKYEQRYSINYMTILPMISSPGPLSQANFRQAEVCQIVNSLQDVLILWFRADGDFLDLSWYGKKMKRRESQSTSTRFKVDDIIHGKQLG